MTHIFNLLLKMFNSSKFAPFRRAFLRSAAMAALLIMASGLLELFIQLARFGGSDIAERFPEILIIFRAVAIMAWLEMSAFWLRMATQPKVDLQFLVHKADGTAMGAAVVYTVNALMWVFRICIFMQLCGFWK